MLRSFSVDEEIFPGIGIEAKAQFFGLCEENINKIDFENIQLTHNLQKVDGEYPLLSEKALKILIRFSTIYRCGREFLITMTMKTKSRNLLDLEHDVRCALSDVELNIKQIIRNKHYQPSH